MKLRLFPVALLALPLAIASCSNPSSEEPTAVVEASTTAESMTSEAPAKPVEVELGETITLTNYANKDSDVDLTINDISITEACHYIADDSVEAPDGGYFIQMLGEVDTKQTAQDFSFSEKQLSGVDAKGKDVETKYADACVNPSTEMDGYHDFAEPVSEGEITQGVLEIWAAKLPETLTYSAPGEKHDYSWSLPELSPSTSTPSATPEPTQTETATPAADEEPYVVECLFGTPGPALWSDGTTAYSEYCFNALGGPEYLEAESQSGLSPSSTWDGYDPNPYRSDGCVGSAAVCGYYDDNGDPIWFDKMTLESSPRYYDQFGNPTMDPEKGSVLPN